MHKLVDFICDELEDLERKAEKDGKLSMAEVQYMDTLAHAKKNLLKADEMMEDGYSMEGGSYARDGQNRMMSYARGRGRNAKRDSMGRYSSNTGYSRGGGMVEELYDLMEDAPDEQTRMEFKKFISKIEQM